MYYIIGIVIAYIIGNFIVEFIASAIQTWEISSEDARYYKETQKEFEAMPLEPRMALDREVEAAIY